MAGEPQKPENKPKRGKGGTFAKGVSGNPGGRSKVVVELRSEALAAARKVVAKIVARLDSDTDTSLKTFAEVLAELLDVAGVRGARADIQREARRCESIVAAIACETVTDANRATLIDQLAKPPKEE
jgi:hypothetical protein